MPATPARTTCAIEILRSKQKQDAANSHQDKQIIPTMHAPRGTHEVPCEAQDFKGGDAEKSEQSAVSPDRPQEQHD